MKNRLALPLIVAVAALAGVVVASIRVPAAGDPAALPIYVPVGRIGDRYEASVDYWERWTEDGAPQDYNESYRFGREVIGLDVRPDRTGMVHDVVKLGRQTWTDVWRPGNATASYIDLATRDELIHEVVVASDPSDSWARQIFGPRTMYGWTLPLNVSDVRFQGMALDPGRDLTGSTYGAVREEWSDENVRDLVHRAWVGERATIDGYDAISVHVEQSVNFSFENPRTGRFQELYTATETYWLAAAFPYPLLTSATYRELISADGVAWEEFSWGFRESLSAFEPGTDPIPWGKDRARVHYHERNPAAELSPPGTGYPTDGAGSTLAYPLENALRSVANDAGLAGFHAWLAQHPQARLAGFQYAKGIGDGARIANAEPLGDFDGFAWSLVYVAPPADGYVVHSALDTQRNVILNRERGPHEVLVPVQDQDREPYITLQEAVRRWELVVPPEVASRGPSEIDWGLMHGYYTGRSTVPNDPTRTSPFALGRPAGAPPNQIGVHELLQESSSAPVLSGTRLDHTLHLNASTGNLHDAITRRQFTGAVPFAQQSLEGGPQAQGAITTPAEKILEPRIVAAATTSILVLLLLGYLLPLAKYALAGFAKLDRDEVLENRTRSQLLDAIAEDPGVTPPELHRRVGGGWSTVVYHLKTLESNKFVSSMIDGRHRRFFPVATVDWSARSRIAVLRNERTRRIFEMIQRSPGLQRAAICQHENLRLPSVDWHVRRLEGAGLVVRERFAWRFRFFARETGHDAGHPGSGRSAA